MNDTGSDQIDWTLTTWNGARREQLRRWAALPLERIVLALEEMQELTDWLSAEAPAADAVHERGNQGSAGGDP